MREPVKQQRGAQAEDLACRHLQSKGLKLITRNYRCPRGEIDLIMDHAGTVVFVEVRYRSNPNFGSGADSVDYRKQCKLNATALHYLQHHDALAKRQARFDVISISQPGGQPQIDWIINAF